MGTSHAAEFDAAKGRWTEIRPATGLLRGLDPREVWTFRQVAVILSRRQMKARYKQAALGVAWAVIQPLVTVVVFSVIFGRVAGLSSDGHPYPVFLVSGLVLWSYVSASVQAATQRLVDDRELVTKIFFPRILAPVASVLVPLVDLAIGLAIALVLVGVYSVPLTIAIVLTPVWIVGAVIVALSAGMLLAALNVQYRDVGQVVVFILQLWMFTSPIVFASSSVHGAARVALAVNPVTGLVDGLRLSLLGGPAPPAVDALGFLSAAVLAIGSLLYFQRVERRFADLV